MAFKRSVFIRRADRDDLDTIVEWMEDPDFHHFLYGDPARSPKQVREQIVGMLGRTAGQTLPMGVYLLIDSDDGPMGILSLQNISWRNRSCSLDLYIRKECRSRAVAALSFFRAMEYAFDELNMHRVAAYIYSFNTPSWRLMEFSGAKRELTLKNHVARDGKLYDLYAYGMLRPEFEQLRAKYAERYPDATLAAMIQALEEKEAKAESQP